MKVLIDRGADINAQGPYGDYYDRSDWGYGNALQAAVKGNYDGYSTKEECGKVMELLLAAGATFPTPEEAILPPSREPLISSTETDSGFT